MATPQQLIDLATQLAGVADSSNTIVSQRNPPYDADTVQLAQKSADLATKANQINQTGLAALSLDLQGAIGQLTTQVTAANATLQQINDVRKALNIVGVVLTGAGSIATSVATGNWIGTAGDVIALATNLQTAINANQPVAAASTAP